MNENREAWIWRKYGLSADAYWTLWREQNGLCAICGEEPERDLVVDHCHMHGHVRGLLCGSCNSGLGFFRDSASALCAADRYLAKDRLRRGESRYALPGA